MSATAARRAIPRARSLIVVALLLLAALPAFAPRPAAAAAATIDIRKHLCPNGFAGSSADIYGLAQNCQIGGAGISFLFAVDNTPISGGGVGLTDGDGQIHVGSVPAGETQITETVPPGWAPRPFCSLRNAADTLPHVYTEYTNPVVQLLHDDERLDCDWYDVQAQTNTATVVINKHGCPDGYDASAASIYDLAQNCHDQLAGVAFQLSPQGGVAQNGATGQDGLLSFPNVASGPLGIDETPPQGYEVFRVFCNAKPAPGGSGDPSGYTEVTRSGGNGADYALPPGYDLFCDWYNAKTPAVTITITKHGCPQGYEWSSADIDGLALNCKDQPTGITFDVIGAASGAGGGQGTGDVVAGAVRYNGLPPDSYGISEQIPAGYAQPIVFCKVTDTGAGPAGTFSPADVSGNSITTGPLTAGQALYCDWYNVYPLPTPTPTPSPTSAPTYAPTASSQPPPGRTPVSQPKGPASLTIVKYTCKTGYDVLAAKADPERDCPKTTGGVAFTLVGGNSQLKKSTGGDGAVLYKNVPAGSYLIKETFPADVTSAFISSCVSDARQFDAYPFLPFAVVGANGTVGIRLVAGENLTCSWYDVPVKKALSATPGAGGATVALTLLDCPGASANPAQCVPATTAAGFSLEPTDGAGTAATLTTDASGRGTVSVDPGVYALTEGDATWCFADSAAFDAKGNLTVAEGATVNVKIYNCGK